MYQEVIALNRALRAKKQLPDVRVGDTIRIHRRIVEGKKERIQVFEGMVLAIKGRQSSSPMATVRKVSFGVGVELIVPLYAPTVEKVEVLKRTKPRQAKVYFAREKSKRELRRKFKEVALPEKKG